MKRLLGIGRDFGLWLVGVFAVGLYFVAVVPILIVAIYTFLVGALGLGIWRGLTANAEERRAMWMAFKRQWKYGDGS